MANKVAEKRISDSLEETDRKMAAEILLAYSKEEWEQRRQSENQRSLMTNFILTISSAALLFIANKGLSSIDTLPFAVFLIVLGIFGAIAVAKLYERGEYHIETTHAWRNKVNELYPEAELLKLKDNARKIHEKKFGNTIRIRIRLHALWVYFNLAIALVGVGLVIYILYK